MRKIEVVSYDPKWKTEFQKAEHFFSNLLSDFDIDIEHVGSTSVPGLSAKPILDIDIIAKDSETVHKIIEKLSSVGYEHRGNLGIADREAFGYNKANPEITWMNHNLYVCLVGCNSLRNHLLFRNYLQRNPDAVKEYGILKKKLADKFPYDIDAYVEGKSEFIVSILSREGLDDNVLEEIKSANKKK